METLMTMLHSWVAYLVRQSALTGTILAGLLLLAELVAPGSVLPFFNLHALVIGVLVLHAIVLAEPSSEDRRSMIRLITTLPVALALALAVWIVLAGAGVSSFFLALAILSLIAGYVIAVVRSA